MNIYYYLIDLWPMLLLLVLVVVVDGFTKITHRTSKESLLKRGEKSTHPDIP